MDLLDVVQQALRFALLDRLHQHLAVADDLVEGSAQRVPQLGKRLEIVGLERAKKRAHAPCGPAGGTGLRPEDESLMECRRGIDQQRVDLPEQPGQIHRLRVVVIAAGLEGLVPVARHRVGGQRDDGDARRSPDRP